MPDYPEDFNLEGYNPEDYDINRQAIIPSEKEVKFNQYINEFNLNVEELKGKKVLDIGSGNNPVFVSQCLERGITQDIYGIDLDVFFSDFEYYSEEGRRMYPKKEVLASEAKKHYLQAKAESLPFKLNSFDLILMRAVIYPEMDLDKVFYQVSLVLKPGAEFKIFPVFRESEERRVLDKFLSKLDRNKFEYEWQEETGEKKYYSARDLLIIRKK